MTSTTEKMHSSFPLVLILTFLNYVGIGLIFPIFSPLMLSADSPFFSPDTSSEVRGIWLGALIALMPLAQFFSSPILGTISDAKGRKNPLIWSSLIAIIGYLIAALGIRESSLALLFLSRLVIGFSTGNTAIAQATIADISKSEDKAKNYSFFGMAMGAGFTMGPFLGGLFSKGGYAYPFLSAALLITLNLLALILFFQETKKHFFKIPPLDWLMGVTHLKKALTFKGLRTVLICNFVGVFGWCFFFELSSVFLIKEFAFTPQGIGYYSAFLGASYALSTGLLIRPLLKRYQSQDLFFWSMILTGAAVFGMGFVTSMFWIWPFIFLIAYLTAPFTPTATAVVSNGVTDQIQGEALGILGSLTAAGYALSPLISGVFVGVHPRAPMLGGGTMMCLGGIIGYLIFSASRKSGWFHK